MAWRSHGTSHATLVAALVRNGLLSDPRAAAAYGLADRADFAPRASTAFLDAPAPIGHGATISAPHMHALALDALAPALAPGGAALDVGCGSGALLPALAALVAPGGVVLGVEHVPQLADLARANVAKSHARALAAGDIVVVAGDGFGPWAPPGGPPGRLFDAIHVGAAAPELPPALLASLRVGGTIVCPVGPAGGAQTLVVAVKTADGGVRAAGPRVGVVYVPLTALDEQDPGNARAGEVARRGGSRGAAAPTAGLAMGELSAAGELTPRGSGGGAA